MKTPQWLAYGSILAGLIYNVTYSPIANAQTNYYADWTSGDNSYDGLSNIVAAGHGPKLNVSDSIDVASGADLLNVASGLYQESTWEIGTKSLTLNPQGEVAIYDTAWWNLITVPPMVISGSSGNSAFVPDPGDGSTYSWSIDNGTIDSGGTSPNVSWTAGGTGNAVLHLHVSGPGGSFDVATFSTIVPCSLESVITASSPVYAGSSNNTASLPTTLVTLYSFTNGVDGADPIGLTQPTSVFSNLYGAASSGGTNEDGTLFMITPSGTFTSVWQFSSNVNGSGPSVPVQGIVGAGTGVFYGVTTDGGTLNSGTIFKYSPSQGLQSIFTFNGTNQGSYPVAVTQGRDGNLYGVTELGGSNDDGVVFAVATNGINFHVLHYFTGTDGSFPNSALVQGTGNDTNFYGTAMNGGGVGTCLNGCGTVFRINPDGTFSNLHKFVGSDGTWPTAMIRGGDSNFYGTTFTGGAHGNGSFFRMTAQGTFTSLYGFSGGAEGGGLDSALVQAYDGNFYGTTVSGGLTNIPPWGAGPGFGTVFRMTPGGTLTTLWRFTGGVDGALPFWAGPAAGFSQGSADGYLYGATLLGGTSTNCYSGCGTVYKLLPATYSWSISNGTVTAGQGTPNITWTAGNPGTVTICTTIADSPVCTNTVCTNLIVAPPPITVHEWYGPFPSWTNVMAFGAVGDGTNDDTIAISNALASVGIGSCSPVLYFPSGHTYRVTHKLWLFYREHVEIVGLDRDATILKYDGATDTVHSGPSTLFHLDNVSESHIARLTFDGNNKSMTIFSHSMSFDCCKTNFDEGNSIVDCVFKNSINTIDNQGSGVDAGYYGQGFANVDFTRCIFTNTFIGLYTWNQSALDGWLTDCYVVSNAVGVYVNQGSAHAYRSAFVDNWSVDYILANPTAFISLVSNTSYHAGKFLREPYPYGNSLTPTLIKGNTIIDPHNIAIEIFHPGPTFLIDNVIACTNTPAAAFLNGSRTDLVAVGNTNAVSNWYTNSPGAIVSTNLVDNSVVARSNIAFVVPPPPTPATNLNRVVVEMGTNFTASSLQSAIDNAADGTVIHIPWISNNNAGLDLNQTITMPTNEDIRIVGDGYNSKLGWSGTANGIMFAVPHPSHVTFSHLQLYGQGSGGHSPLVAISDVGTTSARIYLRDTKLHQGITANIRLGDCPNTTIDYRGIASGSTSIDPANGSDVVLEGRGKVKIINVDSDNNALGLVCTNGGSLYVETRYNEAGDSVSNKILRVSGNSTVTLFSGKFNENVNNPGNTSNSYAIVDFTGRFLLAGLEAYDWMNVSGSTTGSIWVSGAFMFKSPVNQWPIINSTTNVPVETMNWNYDPDVGAVRFNDIGTASATFTRQMLSQARSEYSDLAPMTRRTNQTDVLLENVQLDLGNPNLRVTP